MALRIGAGQGDLGLSEGRRSYTIPWGTIDYHVQLSVGRYLRSARLKLIATGYTTSVVTRFEGRHRVSCENLALTNRAARQSFLTIWVIKAV